MRPEALSFSTKDCLEIVKSHNPKLWLVDLSKPVIKLIKYRALHKITCTKAMEAIIATNQTMADNIITMAAFQHIMNEKVKIYHETVSQITLISQQLQFTIDSKTTPEKDKQELIEYYQDKLQTLEEQRKVFLEQKEVCDALEVNYTEANKNPIKK